MRCGSATGMSSSARPMIWPEGLGSFVGDAYLRSPMRISRVLLLAGVLLSGRPAMCATGDGGHEARLLVQCTRASAFVQVHLANSHRIGKVVMEIRDGNGRVLYHEEGKALTSELVRRLDKGVLPRGTHILSIQGKDLDISQVFTVE